MYLESEVTHQDRQIAKYSDNKKPVARWPGIIVVHQSNVWESRFGERRPKPIMPDFAPRIFGSSHRVRDEIIGVFLTNAQITVKGGASDANHLYRFLHHFASPHVFELVQHLKLHTLQERVHISAGPSKFMRHFSMLRRLELRIYATNFHTHLLMSSRTVMSKDIVIRENDIRPLLHSKKLEEITLQGGMAHEQSSSDNYLDILRDASLWLEDEFAQQSQRVVVKYERYRPGYRNLGLWRRRKASSRRLGERESMRTIDSSYIGNQLIRPGRYV